MGHREKLRRKANKLRRQKNDPNRIDPDPEQETALVFESCDLPIKTEDAIDTACKNERDFFKRQRQAEKAPDPVADARDIDAGIDDDFEVINDL